MKYLIVAVVAASLLAGCSGVGIDRDSFQPFNSGDSLGPRGGDPHVNGGNAGTAARARELAAHTTRPNTPN
jgi:hypothetical protein